MLVPEFGADVVRRSRVVRRFHALLEARTVVAVCASAGAGKTTAVAEAVGALERPVAWVSLDGTEQAGRLPVYLEAAVEQYVPAAGQVASDALRTGLHLGESAGLLAESLQGSSLVIVCDNVERITGDAGSIAVLDAFARYLPAGVNLVLVSRVDVPLSRPATSAPIGVVGDEDLAFDATETAEVLRLAGQESVDVHEVVRRTGGWVTGVRFGAWGGGSTSGLCGFFSHTVLHGLTEDERAFLLHTSLLDEVTVPGAAALGQPEPSRVMARLRAQHLPVSWSRDGTRMTPHGQFRDFLREALQRDDAEVYAVLERRHAEFLVEQGEKEEAVDALLRIGDVGRAWDRAAELLPDLVARGDFAPAARWWDQLGSSSRCPTPRIGAVALRVAFALEQFGRAAELFDRFGDCWLPGPESPDHEEATALAAWCLWHLGRIEDAVSLVSRLPRGRTHAVASVLMALATGEAPALPEASAAPSGPLDGILIRCRYLRGRVSGLGAPGPFDPWRTVLGAPWAVAGLRAGGRIDEAMSVYEQRKESARPLWLHAFDEVELMLDLGRGAEAWTALRRGRELIAESGSRVYHILSLLLEAKLWLRLDQDAEQAERALAAAEAAGLANYAFAREVGQMWRGLALLLRGRCAEAGRVLSRSVESMWAGDRRLELATAAAYLAEAHWRTGDEGRSDRAARLALDVSSAQGVQHLLLAALTDVPEVATRSADASPTRMSRWHEITDLLSRQDSLRVRARSPRLVLEEFGEPRLVSDGELVQPGLTKSVELLSFLLSTKEYTATRRQITAAVFDGRNDAASRSYLRQALFKLRAVLPAELAPTQEGESFAIPLTGRVEGTARAMEDQLLLATRQPDVERLATSRAAIDRAVAGPYLATLTSEWVRTRRTELDERIAIARVDAARIAFRLSRHGLARELLDEVFRRDPYREQAWHLAISLAHATGSDDAVLTVFRRYVAAMGELGVAPSSEVKRLVAHLRR
ncbi:BTAD domain-containing putative transcriptional regulator [Amycolatopsis mongoliensis]|uniref:BTAD domain-containing putative transcriptional regulator n=1 Tax=Amycolatopsis mongoliensis TaxID=715475 RepID=A0A9Y2JMZ3_9PSEU|nr:BTAD domain-containing putative transcriptional regulator [Amycolatopsis sp. 4-36]WIY00998.1 BTAD domain-containing putative transcriptional regulator [Amycolatopsis sp. 4-36]